MRRIRTGLRAGSLRAAGCLLLAALLSGCLRSAEVSGTVVLYTSVPEEIISEMERSFEEAYPAVDLQIYRAGTSEVLARIEQDRGSGRVGADVVWVADLPAGEALKEQGLLLTYRPPEAEALLVTVQDPDDSYFGSRLLNMVLVYNTEVVTTPPGSYWDLVDPRYAGRVGHATPDSGAFMYFMGALLQDPAYGEDFFRQLAANEPLLQTNTETTARIAAGELDIGISIDYTVRRFLQENPAAPIGFAYPASGIVMVASPIAILRDAANVEGAQTFERYVLSVTGQALLRDLAGVVPVRLDVAPPPDIPSVTQLRVIPVDSAWIYAHRGEIQATFGRLYGEE